MIFARLLRVGCSTTAVGMLAVIAAGCSSGGDAGPKYPDFASFCNGRATAECNAEVRASCAAPDQSTCIGNRDAVCLSSKPANSVYASASAEGCISAVGTAYADAKLTLAENASMHAACDPVFDGPGAKNATCRVDADCQQSAGFGCVLSPGSVTGTCQIPQMVMGGGSCAAMDARCVSGFHCGATGHCDIDAALNESCSTIPCAPDLSCSAAAICQAKAPDGSVCVSDGECLNGICNRADPESVGLCVSQIALSTMEPFCVSTR